jgi:hypothetical protein
VEEVGEVDGEGREEVMGQSTDAILALGIRLVEDDPGFEPFDEDANMPKSGPSWMSYMGKPEDGVELISHCSSECPMYFVAAEGTETKAWRGLPRKIDALPEPTETQKAAVMAFVEKHNLNTEGEFGWHLMSDWS